MADKIRVLIAKCIYDKNDRIILIQLPNLPLLVFFVASIFTRYFDSGSANYFFKALTFGSIFIWAWLEIFAGANYFRRMLGLIVLGLSIKSAVVFYST